MNNIGNIIERAYSMAGLIDPSQGLSDQQKLQGLNLLNSLLANWITDEVPIYSNELVNFQTVAGQASYVLSASPADLPDVLTNYPVTKITKMFYRQMDTDFGINEISQSDYDNIPDKSWTVGNFPDAFYFEQNLSDPNRKGTLLFYPICGSVIQIYFRVIYSFQDVPNSAVDVMSMNVPSEFVTAYCENLALEVIKGTPGAPLSQQLMRSAIVEKSKLYRLMPERNASKRVLPAGGRRR